MLSNTDRNTLLINAQRIADAAGYESLVDYAVYQVKWEARDTRILALPEKQSAEALTVLRALAAIQEVTHPDGYYHSAFAAGKEIAHTLTDLRIQQQTAQQVEQTEKAVAIAEAAGYNSLIAYAMHNVKWRTSQNRHSALYAEQTPDARTVLDALYLQKEVAVGTGYYRKDYTAGAQLEEKLHTMDQMEANVQDARTHAQRVKIKNRKEWDNSP